MARPAKTKLKMYMLENIDMNNLIEVDKVERYLVMYDIQKKLEQKIKQHDVIVETVNGSQNFLKENPAINSWTKLEASMMKLLDSIQFKNDTKSDKAITNIISEKPRDKIVAMKRDLL